MRLFKISFGDFLSRALIILLVGGSLVMGAMMAYENEHREIEVRNEDGCQYLVNIVRGGEILTHKGNCKNPIHNANKK